MPVTVDSKEIPIELVGSSVFGRYNTVSASRTYNMFITSSADGKEEWLVNFAGYVARQIIVEESAGVGRGVFHSIRGDFLIAVVGPTVFRIDSVGSPATIVGSIPLNTNEVSIDENLNSQICIVDGTTAYIYNYAESPVVFGAAVYTPDAAPDFIPNYVSFQNTYFIFGNGSETATGNLAWVYKSAYTNTASALTLEFQANIALQTKPDYAVAALPIPGHANSLLVFGKTVAEIYTQVPTLATYQKNQSVNIDYGCASISTIAANENIVAWLAVNEKSSPTIMAMTGGGAQRISSDGIDNLMDTIQHPESSTAFFFRQDGHLFYVLTFYHADDNISLTYDFTTQKFYDLTDWDFSYYPARQVAYFQGQLYFVSIKDTKLYELGSDITQYITFPGLEEYDIPRIRVSDTFRLPTPEKFRIRMFTFVLESGTTPGVTGLLQCDGYILTEATDAIIYTEDDLPILTEQGACEIIKPRIDLMISKSGGLTWSNTVPYYMHNTGYYQCQPRFNSLGAANNITFQLRFWSCGRIVIKNAMVEVGP